MVVARKLEIALKRKKNPQLCDSRLKLSELESVRAAPKAFGVGSGFESRPTQYDYGLGLHPARCFRPLLFRLDR